MNDLTFGELAAKHQAAGRLGTFDSALPQEFADDVFALTGVWPQRVGIVWSYPATGPGRMWGQPFPLTDEAEALLERYALAALTATVIAIAILETTEGDHRS